MRLYLTKLYYDLFKSIVVELKATDCLNKDFPVINRIYTRQNLPSSSAYLM